MRDDTRIDWATQTPLYPLNPSEGSLEACPSYNVTKQRLLDPRSFSHCGMPAHVLDSSHPVVLDILLATLATR
jgi:hypothetical protein